MAQLLVTDDDPMTLDFIEAALSTQGHTIFRAATAEEAIATARRESIDAAIIDFMLPDQTGRGLFLKLLELKDNLPAIFITATPDVEQAVDLMKLGACDYLPKPIRPAALVSRLEQLLKVRELTTEVDYLRARSMNGNQWAPGGYLAGASPAMRPVDLKVKEIADYPTTTVLLTGPTGTGKTAVARKIHELTYGNEAPFVEINCSVIPRELCESELFGHEKGSFTGAHKSRPGLFEAAGSGTAFLDEIGELDLSLQTKLLTILESRTFKRVGGEAPRALNARVIAATNRSLPDLVRDGKFREDLYYRLNVFEITMPALRERPQDIESLAGQFASYYCRQHGKEFTCFSGASLHFLREYSFPGNIRELRNLIERSVILSRGSTLELEMTNPPGRGQITQAPAPDPVPKENNLNLQAHERRMLLQALKTAKGNKSAAARELGLTRRALYRRMEKHGIQELEKEWR